MSITELLFFTFAFLVTTLKAGLFAFAIFIAFKIMAETFFRLSPLPRPLDASKHPHKLRLKSP